MRRMLLAATATLVMAAPALAQDDLKSAIQSDYHAYLGDLYKHFHANPELSLMENETAARLAEELRTAGFEVTENVGGTGLVATMENGEGPTVMLRADMDGLPVEEKTGVDYASTATQEDRRGQMQPVMHACAHDTHMTALVGAARQLAERKDEWSGTLVLIGQPAEEIGLGARDMLEDGLYERFPQPDSVVSFHTFSYIPAGKIGYVPGYAMANVDSVDVHVKGIGGHGSAPHTAKDPIALSAYIITGLQTLVSRDINPLDTGVVTVGAINAGTKHNIIPEEAHLQITVRSFKDEVRQDLLEGIERVAVGQAQAFGVPDDLMPVVEVEEPYTPATYNDPELTAQGVEVLKARFGEEAIVQMDPITGGEDFSRYSRTDEDIPAFMFWVGGTPQSVIDEYAAKDQGPPPNHSAYFAPDPEASVTMGAEGMAAIAMDLMKPQG
ncbi:MAG: amidohydrolase [Euryhalocaulis sp.]|uniref:M20 metallopeptidase family protein n=1 Tax=Euryhalocaulis sp. TaxID=2744307 RepID=UPI001790F3D3|nr:amidohydrolase [Euryhalocaulis sp.]MBA4800742.1 amidohydrolase [Euryhalocaulis sp.]